MAQVTWDEFFKQPDILPGIVSEVVLPETYFTALLGMPIDAAPEKTSVNGRVNWDIQNFPRTVAVGRQSKDGFATKTPKEVESNHTTIGRFAQKTEFYDNDFLEMRPLGQPWSGIVTSDMMNWITREMQMHRMEFDSAWEFMLVRLLQDGFGFTVDNNTKDWVLCEKGAGDFDVDPGMDAANKSQLNVLGTGDIIATAWDDPAALLVKQFADLDVACTIKGRPVIREVHIPPEAVNWLMSNTQLKAIAGTSNRVYDTYEETIVVSSRSPDGTAKQRTIKRQYLRFAGLPHHKFFVQYANFVLGYKDRQLSSVETTAANVTRALGATKAMFLPEIPYLKKFISKVDGAEMIATDNVGGKTMMEGFKTFQHKLTGEQPGWVGKMVYKGLPINKIPNWCYYPTIDF